MSFREEIEKEMAKFTASQKIIDSMEPTELEKKLVKKIEELLEKS